MSNYEIYLVVLGIAVGWSAHAIVLQLGYYLGYVEYVAKRKKETNP